MLEGEHRVVGCLHPMCIFNTWVLARLVWLLVIDITSLIVNIFAMFDWLEQFECGQDKRRQECPGSCSHRGDRRALPPLALRCSSSGRARSSSLVGLVEPDICL